MLTHIASINAWWTCNATRNGLLVEPRRTIDSLNDRRYLRLVFWSEFYINDLDISLETSGDANRSLGK
eukprot:scaffold10861_cov180-Amphora_coffeaeformis.AAC.13